ncbi:MAG: DUF922 domain-containing protein [Bacteroidota bacterium]
MNLKTLCLCLCCFLFLGTAQDEETIMWNENRKLTWADFKGEVNRGTDAVALTASGITFGYSLSRTDGRITGFRTTVEAHFYPHKSWFIEEKADDYILGHEQLHFDITELYTRKLRQQISQLRVSQSIKSQLDNLHSNINEALAKTQNEYDSQSRHSIDSVYQRRWEAFIETELKKLDHFKSK